MAFTETAVDAVRSFPEMVKRGARAVAAGVRRGVSTISDPNAVGYGSPIEVPEVSAEGYSPGTAFSRTVLSVIAGARARANDRFMREQIERERAKGDLAMEQTRALIGENTPSVAGEAYGLPGIKLTRREAIARRGLMDRNQAVRDAAATRANRPTSGRPRDLGPAAARVMKMGDDIRNEVFNAQEASWLSSGRLTTDQAGNVIHAAGGPQFFVNKLSDKNPSMRIAAYRALGLLDPSRGLDTPEKWEEQFTAKDAKDMANAASARQAAISQAALGIQNAWRRRSRASLRSLPIEKVLDYLPEEKRDLYRTALESAGLQMNEFPEAEPGTDEGDYVEGDTGGEEDWMNAPALEPDEPAPAPQESAAQMFMKSLLERARSRQGE